MSTTYTLVSTQASRTIYYQQPRTILGPLPTTFSPPPYCSDAIVICRNCDALYIGRTCTSTGIYYDINDAPGCWPSVTAGVSTPTSNLAGWGIYSPATACPSGYTAACSQTFGSAYSGGFPQFSLTTGETATGCCPAGYQCSFDASNFQNCVSFIETTSISAAICDGTASVHVHFSVPFTFTTTVSQSSVGTGTVTRGKITAPLFQINHRAVDRTATSRATVLLSGPTASAGASGSRGLAGGAIAGIAVGVVVGVTALAALAGAVVLFWLRRRNGNGNGNGKRNLPAELGSAGPEGRGKPVHEAGEGRRRPEMGGVEASGDDVLEFPGDDGSPAALGTGSLASPRRTAPS